MRSEVLAYAHGAGTPPHSQGNDLPRRAHSLPFARAAQLSAGASFGFPADLFEQLGGMHSGGQHILSANQPVLHAGPAELEGHSLRKRRNMGPARPRAGLTPRGFRGLRHPGRAWPGTGCLRRAGSCDARHFIPNGPGLPSRPCAAASPAGDLSDHPGGTTIHSISGAALLLPGGVRVTARRRVGNPASSSCGEHVAGPVLIGRVA